MSDSGGAAQHSDAQSAQEDVLRRVLDALLLPVFWKDTRSVYLGCNAAFAKAVGLASTEEIAGKTDYDLPWPRAEADAYRADDQEVIESRRTKSLIREPLQQSDGTRLLIETTKIPLFDSDGNVWGVLGAYTDITERQRRAAELREARLMLQTVLDTIPVRVFWKDAESRFLGCNQLFATDAGVASPELIAGKTDSDLAWHEQSELYRADDRAVMASGEPRLGYEEPQTTPDGRRIWLRTSKTPLRAPAGDIIGVLGTYEDITVSKEAEERQRRLEAEIHHSQKLESLGVLAGGIAHDFNNLLVAMLGHADLGLASLPSSAPAYGHLNEIQTAARRARELANQMLAYSGRGRFVVRRLQMNDVIAEMGRLLRASIPKKVELRYELADGLDAVDADAVQMRQVVMNLVTNAAEAIGSRSGTVTLATRTEHLEPGEAQARLAQGPKVLPPGGYVCIEVSDDGCGMDAETRDQIFDPFFTTKFHGRGLGLAGVLGIVRGHGGTIVVKSEPRKGSSFKVLLPAAQGGPATEAAPSGPASSCAPVTGTVLVVDDEQLVREATAQMLEHLGLTVLLAADGVEALHVFQRHRKEIRLVWLDMTMPRMDGEETLTALRHLAPTVKVVLVSGYNEIEATSHLVDGALTGFIQKPFTLLEVEAKIRESMS
jgi:two-component system cell cycle sensor histidine kinase/response regulator CckA